MARRISLVMAGLLLAVIGLSACGGAAAQPTPASPDGTGTPTALADLEPVELAAGERLRVVATTNIVADVVAQIGADHIELYNMLPIGADPHAYEPTPRDLRAVADAHVVFTNGLGLEGFVDSLIQNAGGTAVVVPVSMGADTIELGESDHTDESGDAAATHNSQHADPHVWMSVPIVMETWTANVETSLSHLDPDNGEVYGQAAARYRQELATLDQTIRAQVEQIPVDRRKLVTEHRVFGYFARAYGFEQVGTVVASLSTLAEPSAQELAQLQQQIREEKVPAIFVGTTVNPNLVTQLGQDLNVPIIPVYTGSLSAADGPAANYIDFMRYDVSTIVQALK